MNGNSRKQHLFFSCPYMFDIILFFTFLLFNASNYNTARYYQFFFFVFCHVLHWGALSFAVNMEWWAPLGGQKRTSLHSLHLLI